MLKYSNIFLIFKWLFVVIINFFPQIEGSTCYETCGSTRKIVYDTNIKEQVLQYIGYFQYIDKGTEKDIKCWETSDITNMYALLSGYSGGWGDERFQYFNMDLSCWNVSKVTNMGRMFESAFEFNNDVSSWDVSSVTNMSVSK